MIIDKTACFAEATLLHTGGAGTYIIGDWIDLRNVRDIGQGGDLYLVILVDTAATSGGAATLQLSLVSNGATPLVTAGATVHAATPVFPLAQLTAGKSLLVVRLPLEGNAYQRYLGIMQTTGVAAFTGGRVDAFLTPTPAAWKAYADAVN